MSLTDRNVPTTLGYFYDWVARSKTPNSTYQAVLHGNQNHFLNSRTNPFINGAYRSGGKFLSMKQERILYPSAHVNTYREGWSLAYKGAYTGPPPNPWYPPYSWGNTGGSSGSTYFQNLENRGSEAWNAMRPDKPDFTFATSFYELKDTIDPLKNAVKAIRDKVKKVPRKPGKHSGNPVSRTAQYYIALKFGWLPLLNDIRNFVKAQRSKQATLDRLIRDAGRPVKRRRTLTDSLDKGHIPEYDTYYSIANGYGADNKPGHVTQCYTGTGFLKLTYRQDSRTWAEGSFRYFLPPGPKTVVWKKKMLRRIMGQRVTPDQVYNAMPWTWLVDYFTGLGDFIEAVSGGVSDRLVADYAYIMQETHNSATVERRTSTWSDVDRKQKPNIIDTRSVTDTITKGRSRASPFGWGIKSSDLSPTQVAILGALGLSKLP